MPLHLFAALPSPTHTHHTPPPPHTHHTPHSPTTHPPHHRHTHHHSLSDAPNPFWILISGC
ncbi:MAG: hypothetical protein LBI02_04805 [Opitutaceae bacterium]|nr:hypothetical protein [Opitutaceae bacterium]